MPSISHFVYILRCSDGSYYVGVASDLHDRVATHNAGRGPRFTSLRLPVSLVFSEPYPSLSSAKRRERQLKGWSRAKKEALMRGDRQSLRELSRAGGSRRS